MKKASSLIIVLLIVASVSTIVFGTERVALTQYRQASVQTDNIKAQAAAESGIKDALERLRANVNAETTEGQQVIFDLTDGIVAENDKLEKDLDGQVPLSTKLESANFENKWFGDFKYDTTHQYYQMTINYKTDFIGKNYYGADSPDFTDLNTEGESAPLAKDEEIVFSGFSKSTKDIKYAFAYNKTSESCLTKNPLVQIQRIYEGTDIINYQPINLDFNDFNGADGVKSGDIQIIGPDGGFLKTLRIRSYRCASRYALWLSELPINSLEKFGDFKSTIISTGRFGQASVKLAAEYNRITSQLIGIYDFNLYSQGNISP